MTTNKPNNRSIASIWQQQLNRRVRRKKHEMTTKAGEKTTRKEHDMTVTPRQAMQSTAAELLKQSRSKKVEELGQQIDRAKQNYQQVEDSNQGLKKKIQDEKKQLNQWYENEYLPDLAKGYEIDLDDSTDDQEFQDYLNNPGDPELKQIFEEVKAIESFPLKQVGDDISIEDIDRFNEWAESHPAMKRAELWAAKNRAMQKFLNGDLSKDEYADALERIESKRAWMQETDRKKEAESAIDAFAKGEISSAELMKAYDAVESKKSDSGKSSQLREKRNKANNLRLSEMSQPRVGRIALYDYNAKSARNRSVDAKQIEDGLHQMKIKSEADQLPQSQNPFQLDF